MLLCAIVIFFTIYRHGFVGEEPCLIMWANRIIELYFLMIIVFRFLLPQIAAKVAAPLARTNEIIIMSGDNSRMNGEVTRLLAELPVTVNALTGVDMMKVTPPT